MSPFTFYNRSEYFDELIRSAESAKPGDSMTLMTMVFDPSVPAIASLMRALTSAAQRGVSITLVIDAYSFLLSEGDKPGPLLMRGTITPDQLVPPFSELYATLAELRKAGGSYHIINQPSRAFSLPIAGRSHIKLALINDRVFIGGCNFDDTEYLDLMTSWCDQTDADKLRKLVNTITTAGSVHQAFQGQDQTLELSSGYKIFVDSGIRHQSLILEQAYQLIDEAKEHLTITCQYFPGGRTGQRLLAAHKRGVDVKIHYSNPATHGNQMLAQKLYNYREKQRLPASFFSHELPAAAPKLHAKLLVSESAMMIGSHNYVGQGVWLGTAEIALLIRDTQVSQSANHILQRLLHRYQI